MNSRNIQFCSNRMRDIELHFLEVLAPFYSDGEIRQFVRLLAEEYLGWDCAHYLLHRTDCINQSDLLKFHWALEDLKQYRPIQHIIGHTEFCGCKIEVNENVLIPRPETEEMVMRIVDWTQEMRNPKILDLCTGSGCIAIALSRMIAQSVVCGVDVSKEALEMAKRNTSLNKADVRFLECDLLGNSDDLPREKFDLIVSNPPYIRFSENQAMLDNVLKYEPHLALFVDDSDPLVFYRTIGHYATDHLSEGGLLVFEINESLSVETCSLLENMGFSAALSQDFRGKDRMVKARRIE